MKSRQSEAKRAEKELEFLTRKIERYFDGEIVEFLIGLHMAKSNTCDKYTTYPGNNCNKSSGTGTTTAARSYSISAMLSEVEDFEDFDSPVLKPASPSAGLRGAKDNSAEFEY